MRTIEELMALWDGPPIGAFERLHYGQRIDLSFTLTGTCGDPYDALHHPLAGLQREEMCMMLAHWSAVRRLVE